MILHSTRTTTILVLSALCLLIPLSLSYPLLTSSRQALPGFCTSGDDCSKGDECTFPGNLSKCEGRNLCICLPKGAVLDICQDDKDCKSNNCRLNFCVPSDTTNAGVCIGAHLLTSFHKTQLVFDSHQKANVLCDQFGSCATPGHIVHWKGEAMMMRTYCKRVDDGCNKQVMLVNSPRYERKLRVDSLSPHLSFTAFAARFESVGEELLLRSAVRMGL